MKRLTERPEPCNLSLKEQRQLSDTEPVDEGIHGWRYCVYAISRPATVAPTHSTSDSTARALASIDIGAVVGTVSRNTTRRMRPYAISASAMKTSLMKKADCVAFCSAAGRNNNAPVIALTMKPLQTNSGARRKLVNGTSPATPRMRRSITAHVPTTTDMPAVCNVRMVGYASSVGADPTHCASALSWSQINMSMGRAAFFQRVTTSVKIVIGRTRTDGTMKRVCERDEV